MKDAEWIAGSKPKYNSLLHAATINIEEALHTLSTLEGQNARCVGNLLEVVIDEIYKAKNLNYER